VARREWHALYKSHNAALACWGGSRRASQEGAICGVQTVGDALGVTVNTRAAGLTALPGNTVQ
jgi:hypothetical protein